MSHVAQVELQIMDLDALGEACTELGLELRLGQKQFRWWGRSVGDYALPEGFKASELGKCEHAISIPDDNKAYEIGVVPRRDGKPGYALLWDFFAGGYGMEAKVGKDACKLKQAYSAAVATKHYRRLGYRVSVEKKGDERLVIKCRK